MSNLEGTQTRVHQVLKQQKITLNHFQRREDHSHWSETFLHNFFVIVIWTHQLNSQLKLSSKCSIPTRNSTKNWNTKLKLSFHFFSELNSDLASKRKLSNPTQQLRTDNCTHNSNVKLNSVPKPNTATQLSTQTQHSNSTQNSNSGIRATSQQMLNCTIFTPEQGIIRVIAFFNSSTQNWTHDSNSDLSAAVLMWSLLSQRRRQRCLPSC